MTILIRIREVNCTERLIVDLVTGSYLVHDKSIELIAGLNVISAFVIMVVNKKKQ